MVRLLSDSPEILRSRFYDLQSIEDLSNLLDVNFEYIKFYLYRVPPQSKYFRFEIPKRSGGTREILAPSDTTKIIQQKLNQILQAVYDPWSTVHGFTRNRNIVTNARVHRKQKFVLNIDLEDFFPSIHFGRVRGMFMAYPYNRSRDIATVLARLTCLYRGLPQGAPTSPVIANMVCSKLDSQLYKLAKEHRCYYTRYADDITFSTSSDHFPDAIAKQLDESVEIGEQLFEIINSNNFTINSAKIRMMRPTQRQEVTGLTVNRFPNVNRKYLRDLKAILHNWSNDKETAEARFWRGYSKPRFPQEDRAAFEVILRGRIEFVGMVRGKDDPIYRRYLDQYMKVSDPNYKSHLDQDVKLNQAKIFLNYAREDLSTVQQIYNRLKRAGFLPWMDRESIQPGDEWRPAIFDGIDSVDVFIPCLSSVSIVKGGVLQDEIDHALRRYEQEFKRGDRFIIPLRLVNCDVPDKLKYIQWFDYFEANWWERLTQSIQEAMKRRSVG